MKERCSSMLIDTVRLGLGRGLIEFRQSLTLVLNYIFFPCIALIVMYFLRGVEVSGSGTSLGSFAIPGVLAINVLFSGLMGLATNLIAEREDGSLLRVKSLPYGIHTYLVGKISSQVALTFITFCVVLIGASVLFGQFVSADPVELANLVWILPLGMTATLPFGAILGSLVKNPRNLSFVSLLLMALVSVSGVLYPLANQAYWMQAIGQATPLYWLGQALRAALLGDAAAAAEIGGRWHLAETALVLGAWSVVGCIAAVFVLRRAARRDAGAKISGAVPARAE
ncbi:hypothetical protein CH254_20050 [Rhodococcus sp. 06-412-2C]|nr:hypothetical protein CH254_20050 [Rhodococcus sp. 06-412-2C]OZC98356.1 hypothetical protein CH279_12695 [Rhodococcus sp. 06-412-2B]